MTYRTILTGTLLASSVVAQMTAATVKTTYNAGGRACVLTSTGPATEREVMKIFDSTVPPELRGAKKRAWLDCSGFCMRGIEFEKLDFSFGIVPGQISDPAAIITFLSDDCKQVVEHSNKNDSFVIHRSVFQATK